MDNKLKNRLASAVTQVRRLIIKSTTSAGSGHPSSCLSAVDLMTVLFFGGFYHYSICDRDNIYNDRVIFSKGHAAPLLYSLYTLAGAVKESDLMGLRTFGSHLEGHPTLRFVHTEAATGSLGQGLSVGLGTAIAQQRQANGQKSAFTYVLLGDSECAEGQVWEAAEVASYMGIYNLIAIIDVNRLGQRGETMLGWNITAYKQRFESFGWNIIVLKSGHNIEDICSAYKKAKGNRDNPTAIIAKTIKGKGVKLLENKEGWHGKILSQAQAQEALKQLPLHKVSVSITAPEHHKIMRVKKQSSAVIPKYMEPVATRQAYGDALKALGDMHSEVVVLDAEVSNSTYSNIFKKKYKNRFFEMFIAEQNMISTAVGLARRGYTPFISTFAAFLTRAFDQIRMAQYSHVDIHLIGSHAGVSIGEDGASQMGLEDIAMMRSIRDSAVVYPSDPYAAHGLISALYNHSGIGYMRTTRAKTPVIYNRNTRFTLGGSYVWGDINKAKFAVITAGITVHEALKAQKSLQKEAIDIAVVDCYSIKPIDKKILWACAVNIGKIAVVEDHYPYGGLGDAVRACIVGSGTSFVHCPVSKEPRSGTKGELLSYEEIDADFIYNLVINSL